ncbi:MAG TPA: hypothetical protein DCS24_04820, partial [Erythrobacter sp.]|nr:hypothetical protein [Erythrobacter sp.]
MMNKFKGLAFATISGLVLAVMSFMPAVTSAQNTGSIPVDVWALRSIVNSVQVSPDGKHLLVHKIE